MKINEFGEILWTRNYRQTDQVSEEYRGSGLATLSIADNGDIAATGWIYNVYDGQQITDLWVIKVDSNGCFGEGDCGEITTSTQEPSKYTSEFTVYPNPVRANSDITLHYDMTNALPQSYTLLTIDGKILQRGMLDTSATLPIGNIPSGMYFIRINLSDGGSSVVRIVVAE